MHYADCILVALWLWQLYNGCTMHYVDCMVHSCSGCDGCTIHYADGKVVEVNRLCDIAKPNIKLFIWRPQCVNNAKGMHHN